MFNSRILRIAIIMVTVLVVGVWWAVREKSNEGKTVAQNATDQIKESNDKITTVVINPEKKREIQSDAGLIIAGVVRDQAGMSINNLDMRIVPSRNWVLQQYAEGRFEAIWRPREPNALMQGYHIIARHEKRNLAVGVEIKEDTKTLDIKLEPGVILTGKVVDTNGKALENAIVGTALEHSNWRAVIPPAGMETDADGRFSFSALPIGYKYSFYARLIHYRPIKFEFTTVNARDNSIDLGSLVLTKGELSISGIVVDVNDKPVSGVELYCTGEGQPGTGAVTDVDGKFKLDNIFEGDVQVSAGLRRRGYGMWDLWGSINAKAGATNVKIVLNNKGEF